jgi:hypothetical protein
MNSRSRGALSHSHLRESHPYCVRIDADLVLNCGINIAGGWPSVYRFTNKRIVDGRECVIYRFSDRDEARRFADWTIGTLMDPDD